MQYRRRSCIETRYQCIGSLPRCKLESRHRSTDNSRRTSGPRFRQPGPEAMTGEVAERLNALVLKTSKG